VVKTLKSEGGVFSSPRKKRKSIASELRERREQGGGGPLDYLGKYRDLTNEPGISGENTPERSPKGK